MSELLTVLILLSAVLICAGLTEIASRVVTLWRSARSQRPRSAVSQFVRRRADTIVIVRYGSDSILGG